MEDIVQEFSLPPEGLSTAAELELPLREFDAPDVTFPERSGKDAKKMIILITTILTAVGINCGVLTGTDTTAPADEKTDTAVIIEEADTEASVPGIFMNEGGRCHITVYNDQPFNQVNDSAEVLLDATLDEADLESLTLPLAYLEEDVKGYSFVCWFASGKNDIRYIINGDRLNTSDILRIPVHDGLREIEIHALWSYSERTGIAAAFSGVIG